MTLAEAGILDLTVDGADEVDPQLDLIKGYGRDMVREKIVAASSRRLIILVGDEKLVPQLGTRGKLPVEVVPFALPLCERRLRDLGCEPVPYFRGGSLFVTDNGNHILDCQIDPIPDATRLEMDIRAIPGVVGTGLFLGMADTVLVGDRNDFRLHRGETARRQPTTAEIGSVQDAAISGHVIGGAMSTPNLWKRYQQYLCQVPSLGLTLDVSRMRFEDGFLERMDAPMQRAFEAMDALERGDIANPDENRMVGHYWLRAPDLAPSPAIAAEIRSTLAEIKRFAGAVHDGTIRTPAGLKFTHVLSIGIGGSALGPMFVADALGHPSSDPMKVDFIDNTDPDGIARILHGPAGRIHETLCIVISKSGGTPEPRNAMLLVDEAFRKEESGFPQARRGRHHARLATRPHRHRTRLARPLSHVRLGRRTHERAVGSWPLARGASGA